MLRVILWWAALSLAFGLGWCLCALVTGEKESSEANFFQEKSHD